MKLFFLFVSFLFFVSCSQSSENISVQENIFIQENSQKIQKPTFENIDEKNILLVPSVDSEGIFAAKNFFISLQNRPMFDVERDGTIDGGKVFGIFVQDFLVSANISLVTHTNIEKFIQNINSARTEISTDLFFETNLTLLKDKKEFAHRDLPSVYNIKKNENSITSNATIYPPKNGEFASFEMSQYDILGRNKNPEKIFVDFEKIRDAIEVENFSLGVDFDSRENMIPKVIIFEKSGEKIEIKTVFLSLIPDEEMLQKSTNGTLYWCYENVCNLNISKEKLKNIDFVEFSYIDAKQFFDNQE